MNVRPVKIAPLYTPCGFKGCATTRPAMHILTEGLPIAPAGTALCGFHSPYDVTDADRAEQITVSPLRRWEVTFTPGRTSRKNSTPVHTFTWGETYGRAYARTVDFLERNENGFRGYEFTLSKTPTL